MAKYWRVSPRFWYQSHLSDDAKLLALYMLTCEHRELEGLFRLPKEYICADLGWSAKRLAKPFRELLVDEFIDYDDAVGVVLIHKALKYQRPENPNQEKHALDALEALPRTALFAGLLSSAERFAKRFAERLHERFGEPFGKPPTPTPALAPAPKSVLRARAKAPADTAFDEFWAAYPRKIDKDRARRAWAARTKAGDEAQEMIAAAGHYYRWCTESEQEQRYIKHAATFIGPDRPYRDWIEGIPEAAHGGSDNGLWAGVGPIPDDWETP